MGMSAEAFSAHLKELGFTERCKGKGKEPSEEEKAKWEALTEEERAERVTKAKAKGKGKEPSPEAKAKWEALTEEEREQIVLKCKAKGKGRGFERIEDVTE